MKKPSDVGQDFDRYAKDWAQQQYRMEAGYADGSMQFDDTKRDQVARPGDEWGETAPLRDAYGRVIQRYVPTGPVNVLEIGAGGGRSTAVMTELLGARAAAYHVVDVSAEFVKVLEARIQREVDIHVVTDVDLSFLAEGSINLCFSQSAWSHINLYDQYRYLREIQRVLARGAPLYVHGQFLLGLGDGWTWNRFQRRVSQIDRRIEGVFHEFTSDDALAEMLTRLGYDIDCVFNNGFVATRGTYRPEGPRAELPAAPSYPYRNSIIAFLTDGRAELRGGPATAPKPSGVDEWYRSARRFGGRAKRKVLAAVRGLRRS
jgi:SAM-dependent methyltransferase